MCATFGREANVANDELARLVAAIERHTPENGICLTSVQGLILARLVHPSAPSALMVDPSLCLVVQGAKEVFLADEVYRYEPGQAMLISVDLPISARVVKATPAKPCLAVRLSLDLSLIGELLADCPCEESRGPLERGVNVSPVEPQLLDAIGRLVALLDSPQTLGPLVPLVIREITYRVLIGPQGARLRQIVTAGAPARQIARAIRWLQAHFAESLTGEALARQAQMSLSGFHQHFKTVTA